MNPLVADVAGDGPTVVLLHGQPGAAANWWRVVPLLTDRWRVVTPDRPGYGRTGGPAGGFSANAAAVVDLLDRLRIDSAVLVGHSWAGVVAMVAALDAPGRVAGIGLVASVAPGRHLARTDRVLAQRPVGELSALATLGLGSFVVHDARSRRLVQRLLPPSSFDVLAHTTPRPGAWRAFAVEQRALVDELDDVAGRLASLSVPAEVLHGDSDRIVPPADAEALAAAVAGGHLRTVSGAGHLLPWEHPSAVAASVDALRPVG